MGRLTLRAGLAALAASAVAGLGCALRGVPVPPVLYPVDRRRREGCQCDQHERLYGDVPPAQATNRRVEEIPGGVRTTTESNSPDLAYRLHGRVSRVCSHLDHGAEFIR